MSGNQRVVFLDGQFLPADWARVRADDRGLLFGDGLFETFCAFEGRVYLLQRHLDRLRASASTLSLGFPSALESGEELVRELCRRNALEAARVRVTLTRGAYDGHLVHGREARPTCLISAAPLEADMADLAGRRRLRWTARLTAWHTGPLAGHKTLSYLPHVLAQAEALRAGDDQALVRDGQGRPVEGATANLFAVRRGTLLTPSIRQGCLPGIIRGRLIELARALGIKLRIGPLTLPELRAADEAFVTNAVVFVMPLSAIDGRSVADGAIGPLTKALQNALLDEVCAATGRK